ncbi:DUF3800 domain-containing protein [Nocardiopsis sp. HUAS JQ3]|uniref:DUF3800 domain-containing protein n=1 Tax=Nocardiopsis sp. HUAS JQ3 TaxID=3061629 RepID=UPI0023A9D5A1|nr:DUF3800 domain-containing protein [Nocardiopsis sp. HUAS JQ3]WDZ91413.1 hypothetical protein PV789_02230 [Nocardiopsis sp. HUAS JQ3]
MQSPLIAYADESFLEHDHRGYYVVANAIVDPQHSEEARQAMDALRGGRRIGKTHWTEMDVPQRKQASDAVAAIEGVHIIAVGTPVPPRRQERARARCLEQLVPELHDYGVETMIMEARSPALNKRDIRTIIGARYALPKGAQFTIEHTKGAEEPLLWVADVLAGAVRAGREGDETYRSILGERIYEIDVATGC